MLTRNNDRQWRKYAPISIPIHPRNSRINIEGNPLRAQYPSLVEMMNKPWDVLSPFDLQAGDTYPSQNNSYGDNGDLLDDNGGRWRESCESEGGTW